MCMRTRVVYLDIACGATTEEWMHVIRCTSYIRTLRQLTKWRRGWDQDKLAELGAEKGMEFYLNKSNRQHQNGIFEVIIKFSK